MEPEKCLRSTPSNSRLPTSGQSTSLLAPLYKESPRRAPPLKMVPSRYAPSCRDRDAFLAESFAALLPRLDLGF